MYGYIAIEISNASLIVDQQRLGDVSTQSTCGLPQELQLFRFDNDKVPALIFFSFPRMEWVDFQRNSCFPEPQILHGDGAKGTLQLNNGMSFDYLFSDLEVGETLFRKLQTEGAVADIRCAINQITELPAENIVCNLDSVVVRTLASEVFYKVNWEHDKYVDKWGAISPLPN